MQCEMCGKETSLFTAEVEGARMQVCKECARFGKIIRKPVQITKAKRARINKGPEKIQSIVSNYGQLIKEKREKLGLKQEELARKLAMKESVIHNVESNRLEPSIDLARRFERFLKIKLVEEGEISRIDIPKGKGGEMTIGDMIKIKKK